MRPAFLVLAALDRCDLVELGRRRRRSARRLQHLRPLRLELREAGRRSDPVRRRHPVPGAGFITEGDLTMSVEAGVFLRGGWAIAASGTIPTTISNIAAGTLDRPRQSRRRERRLLLRDRPVSLQPARPDLALRRRRRRLHARLRDDRRRRHRHRRRFRLGSGRPGRHRLPPQRARRPLRRRQALLDLDRRQRHARPHADHGRGDGRTPGSSPPASASASSLLRRHPSLM